MFTGIVKELGIVRKLNKRGNAHRLEIESKAIYKDAAIGDSISINGVCLTLVGKEKNILFFDVMNETIAVTNLVKLREGEAVNAEGALRSDGILGGHFVLGHIDCVGKIGKIKRSEGQRSMEIEIPKGFDHLIVEKGSVAVDGISLTIGKVAQGAFTVYLIPHTLDATTLGMRREGDYLNIEFDVIGKYLARSREIENPSRITDSFLKEHGY